MARSNPIRTLMESPLPSISYQRKKQYRPSQEDLILAYNSLNQWVFDNTLVMPELGLIQAKKCWGYCEWLNDEQTSGSYCIIRLNRHWFCQQWFLNTLAHEMVHQYQHDVYRMNNSVYQFSGAHGPSFFMWRERFAYFGLTLKTAYGQKRWFKHQDFTKC